MVKFKPFSFIYVTFQAWGLRKMLGAMKNWGKWSEIDDVRLPDAILGNAAIENLWSTRIFTVNSRSCWLKYMK